jgi:hypothetical protein
MTMIARPIVLSFVLCRDLIFDLASGEASLHRPFNEQFSPEFPLHVHASIFSLWREMEGSYRLDTQLMDAEGEVVWSCEQPQPVYCPSRFAIQRVILHPLWLYFPRPGLYDLILRFDGEEVFRTIFNTAQRPVA